MRSVPCELAPAGSRALHLAHDVKVLCERELPAGAPVLAIRRSQPDRELEQLRGRIRPAAVTSAACGVLEQVGDLRVGASGRKSTMARLLLRVFADAREPRMEGTPLRRRQLVVQRRPDQRMPELDEPVAKLQRVGLERGREAALRAVRRPQGRLDRRRRRP